VLLRYVRARPADDGPPEKVIILLVSAWGMGGTIRAGVNLAEYLAPHREVEIISTYRRRTEPYFPFPDGVTVTALDDERPEGTPLRLRWLRRALRSVPSVLYHPTDIRRHNHTLWTDIQLVRRLRGERGFVLGTRPGLVMLIADLAVPGLVTVGVEQMNLPSHSKPLRRAMLHRYPRLDALTVLTSQDARNYERALDGSAPPMWLIPNTVQQIEPPHADLSARRILAAGRYTYQKGYDLLIPAFAPVAAKHPDWQLKICGRGRDEAKLRRLVERHGLEDQVDLAGPTDDVPGEMAQASIYALSSRFEGFPLVLIEAMSKGMAVVAFDCPTGPADIIEDHRSGLLVPPKDVEGFSAALMEMIEDEELRYRCGPAAVERARDYTLASIGPKWDGLFATLGGSART
jgi:glycosyltransferase involved in cell wall biosynthesis